MVGEGEVGGRLRDEEKFAKSSHWVNESFIPLRSTVMRDEAALNDTIKYSGEQLSGTLSGSNDLRWVSSWFGRGDEKNGMKD